MDDWLAQTRMLRWRLGYKMVTKCQCLWSEGIGMEKITNQAVIETQHGLGKPSGELWGKNCPSGMIVCMHLNVSFQTVVLTASNLAVLLINICFLNRIGINRRHSWMPHSNFTYLEFSCSKGNTFPHFWAIIAKVVPVKLGNNGSPRPLLESPTSLCMELGCDSIEKCAPFW